MAHGDLGREDHRSLGEQFRGHFTPEADHLYAVLLRQLADDLDAGGITANLLQDRLSAPRSDVVHLRLLAGIFRIVLRGDAPRLVPFYPALGGTADPAEAWPHVEPILRCHADELRASLDIAPQTNEPGRAACLAVGLTEAVREHGIRRIRLLEPGASAGLNLNVDRYRIVGPGWAWGDPGSPLVFDVDLSNTSEHATIVERRGCDLHPVDATTPDGADYLTSFVWPFHLARHDRLAAALDVLRRHPVTIDRAGASEWLAAQLAEPRQDVLTVVWQSITEQYWPAAESIAVQHIVAHARDRMPLAHVSLEGVPPPIGPAGYDVVAHGAELRVDGRLIGHSTHHGPPIVLPG